MQGLTLNARQQYHKHGVMHRAFISLKNCRCNIDKYLFLSMVHNGMAVWNVPHSRTFQVTNQLNCGMFYDRLLGTVIWAMEITNEFIEKHGFKRINNSMWRNENCTLQNGYTHKGNNIYEKILNTKKAFRACANKKFIMMIENENDFYNFMGIYGAEG